jgi:preprotein translocase subunit SecD
MIKKYGILINLVFILVVLVIAILIDIPKGPNLRIGSFFREFKIHRGLDLQGGTSLLYIADLSKISEKERSQAIEGAIDIIRKRVDGLGVTEPVIQATSIGDKQGIIVELPGIQNVEEAIKLLGETAQLKFITENGQEVLTGKELRRASLAFSPAGGGQSLPEVNLEFNDEGREKFATATKENLGKRIIVILDNQIITAPVVQSVITDGRARITGNFTVEEARKLTLQLNSGALPVPLTLAEQRNIGATLGDKPLKESAIAGLLGILLVMLFMVIHYKLPGLLADIALVIYTAIVLALFKFIPVTLTLAGVAGFILSVGMAVDANILIFERMREELRKGKILTVAIEDGFRRAWSSIRDSNVSSIITCLILIWFGSGSVRGFAVTLLIGILVSMFSAIYVSRVFLRLAAKNNKVANLLRI